VSIFSHDEILDYLFIEIVWAQLLRECRYVFQSKYVIFQTNSKDYNIPLLRCPTKYDTHSGYTGSEEFKPRLTFYHYTKT